MRGLALAVAEAMAAGVPVIASDVDGLIELLDHGRYGLLFRSDDYIDLANKIEQVVRMYEDRMIEPIANQSYQQCVDNFDIKTTALNYCKHYLLNQAYAEIQ